MLLPRASTAAKGMRLAGVGISGRVSFLGTTLHINPQVVHGSEARPHRGGRSRAAEGGPDLSAATRAWACRAPADPRGSHAAWAPSPDRPDPVDLSESQATDRQSDLASIRYARMTPSPFAFMRGAAIVIAHDLASTPKTGIQAQLCGDAHLLNFGVYASVDPSPWTRTATRRRRARARASRAGNRARGRCGLLEIGIGMRSPRLARFPIRSPFSAFASHSWVSS